MIKSVVHNDKKKGNPPRKPVKELSKKEHLAMLKKRIEIETKR